jgi:hypothetical protein
MPSLLSKLRNDRNTVIVFGLRLSVITTVSSISFGEIPTRELLW